MKMKDRLALRTARLRKEWRKGGAALACSLGSAARWRHPARARAQVACELAGKEARAVLRAPLAGGRDNLHLRLYESTPGGAPFVEKASRNLPEYRVASALAGAKHTPVLPQVFGSSVWIDRFVIHMEYIERAAGFAAPGALADPLARALHRLARDGRALTQRPGLAEVKPYFRAFAPAFFAHLRNAEPGDSRWIDSAMAALRDLPPVLSHNDLNAGNILRLKSDPEAVAFVDFGSMGLNHAGADLHGLASDAMDEGDDALLRDVAHRYGGMMGLAPDRLLLAAHLFAASHSLNKQLQKGSRTPFERPARLFRAGMGYL